VKRAGPKREGQKERKKKKKMRIRMRRDRHVKLAVVWWIAFFLGFSISQGIYQPVNPISDFASSGFHGTQISHLK
jgi:hypothetical protein